MMKMKKSTNRKFLTTAVMCSLLAMGSSSAWAAQQTTETVNYGTNVSTAANPYSKIEVKTTDASANGIVVYDYDAGNLQVYMSAGGVINVSAAPTAKDISSNAYGIQNYHSAASQTDITLIVTGPTTLTMDSTGSESTGGDNVSGNAFGMDLGASSRTSLEAVKATVTAVGGNITGMVSAGSNLYAAAYASGVEASQANLATGAASFTVTGQGGTVSGSATSAEVRVYGVDARGGTTAIGGDLALTITAAGGTVAGSGELALAYADAYGVNIEKADDAHLGSLIVNGTISGSVMAQGGTAKRASIDSIDSAYAPNSYGGAYGITNNGATLQADGASLTVTAVGGTATNSFLKMTGAGADAGAYGINTSGPHTTSITGATKLTVQATGGTATTKTVDADNPSAANANADAYGVKNDNTYDQTSSGVTASTLTLGSLAAEVAATAGNAQDVDHSSENSMASVNAYGISNTTYAAVQDTNPTATAKFASADLMVTATGGTAADVYVSAYGIYDYAQGGTVIMDSTGLVKTTVAATGGTSRADWTTTNATGIYNAANESTVYYPETQTYKHVAYGMATFQAGSVESNVTASGGSASAATGTGYVSAIGVDNYGDSDNKATLTVTGSTTVAATATANATTPSYVEAMGLYNGGDTSAVMSLQDTTVKATATGGNIENGSGATTTASAISNYGNVTARNLNLTATATGGAQLADATQTRETDAYGIYSSRGTVSATGAATIKTSVTPGGGDKEYFVAASLYAEGNGTINVGTDGSQATGTNVQLEGDVQAASGGTVNLTLATAASYLQGNVFTASKKTTGGDAGDAGTVNLTVTNGAAWRPVYDNRYGSQNTVDMTNTYDEDGNYLSTNYTYNTPAQTATTTENSIGSLTLSDGGKVDLTWDNATRDPAAAGRTLTIGALSGDGGIFKVNTNLAKNVADEITITNNAATNLGIDVAYDPALAVSGLGKDSSIIGNAKVLTVTSGTQPKVTGVADSYNTYDYLPTVVDNGDGTYAVTGLTITNVQNTVSRPMREARHQRMAMHNLWVNGELNNMEKRMGDLRAAEPAEAGIWARYEYNKLDKGSDANLKYNYFQLGYDKDFKGDTGTFYRGVAFSYAKGTGNYEVGTGDLKEGTMTLYQTWIGKSGNYYDIVAKAGKLLNDYNAVNTANPYTSDYHSWAYSIGGEVGKRFKKDNGFFVEPQFEFTLGRINGADYTTSTGMKVNVDAQNSAIARIGVAVGKEIKNVGSYYAKASYFHDFGGGLNLTASDSTTNPFSYGEDSAKNWCIFTLGGAVKASKNCNVFGELSKYTGELSNNVQVNVGARWSF